ncbi:hypothetical protein [Amycolatopsis sp. cmx-4-54]
MILASGAGGGVVLGAALMAGCSMTTSVLSKPGRALPRRRWSKP